MASHPARAGTFVGFICVLAAATAQAQDLGHKFPGGVGVDAGRQGPPGVFIADRLAFYSADEARDRNGDVVPIVGLDIDAFANAIGIAGTFQIARGPFLTATVSAPYARISLNSTDPRASVDRLGFGDVYVMPAKLGWRFARFDVVTSYGMYIPTGQFEPVGSGGVGRGFWTHQFSAGGAVFFDEERRARATVLASYDLNLKKRDIDITRGDSLQLQGGAGVVLLRFIDVGVAGYALWQVTDDTGSDVPALLRGARDRVFAAGPEVSVMIPALRAKVGARYQWEFGVLSRPQGRVLLVSVDFTAWRPRTGD